MLIVTNRAQNNILLFSRNWKQIHRLAGGNKGFKGAIQKLTINGNPLAISTPLPNCGSAAAYNNSGCSLNITYYDGYPCSFSQNPCLNDGICIPELGDFTCKCKSNFRGRFCEIGEKYFLLIVVCIF